MNLTKRKIPAVFGMIIVIGVGAALFFQYQNQKKISPAPRKEAEIGVQSCVTRTEEKIVRGNSLAGIIEDGQTVKILFDYYRCNKVKRGDVVAYNYAGNPVPIIKIVKALPGNSFSLKRENNYWNIIVNGKILENSYGTPYILDERESRLLSLYERDYNGIIPEDGYLILGNLPTGTLDSTRFGLVSKSDITGKVVLP